MYRNYSIHGASGIDDTEGHETHKPVYLGFCEVTIGMTIYQPVAWDGRRVEDSLA